MTKMTGIDEKRKIIIENYIRAYNNFDIAKMLENLDENIVFRNVAGGVVDFSAEGIDEFEKQAEQAKSLFSRREQKVQNIIFGDAEIEAEIFYCGTIARDMNEVLKAGTEIKLSGKSIFRFAGDKIVEITDIS